jgi:hypothetical protein
MLRYFSTPDTDILASLEQALYKSDEPLSDADRRRLIEAAAAEMSAYVHEPLDLITQANYYERIRTTLLEHWNEIPFESRMSLREMAIAIYRYESHFNALAEGDQAALVAALTPEARELFIFSRVHNTRMLNDIRPRLRNDAEVAKAPTVDDVWGLITQLDPKMEAALLRPVGPPSNFVERDLEKTARRRKD